MMFSEIARETARANDLFRRSCVGEQLKISPGVKALRPVVIAAALKEMRTCEEFKSQIDPYGYHDFGSFEIEGHSFYFMITSKIDDRLGNSGSDLAKMCKLMLATEYPDSQTHEKFATDLDG